MPMSPTYTLLQNINGHTHSHDLLKTKTLYTHQKVSRDMHKGMRKYIVILQPHNMIIHSIIAPGNNCGFGRCGSQGFAWQHNDVTEWIIEPDCDHVVWLYIESQYICI